MKFNQPFDAAKYISDHGRPAGNYEPLPAGMYEAEILEVDTTVGKNNDCKMFVVKLAVDHDKGQRRVTDWPIYQHDTSAAAVEIGMRRFSSMCVAAGFDKLNDPEDLVGRRVQLWLKVDGTFNKPTSYEPIKDSPPDYETQRPQPMPQPKGQTSQQGGDQAVYDMDDDLPF